MKFTFEERPSDSPLVETIWRTESEGGGAFTSLAESRWGMVVTRQPGRITLTVRGPETKAMPAPVPEDAEFMGINFRLGTFMPCLPARNLVDNEIHLPEAVGQSFWLHGAAWEFPNFENVDTFINRLIHDGLLAYEPIVGAALDGQLPDVSLRSVQRRFVQATGLTYKTIQQIERARQALSLLQQGSPILDTTHQLGFFDQSHLTNSLRHFMGQTPAQILRLNPTE